MQAIGCLVFAVYGLAQLAAAWLGLDFYVGAFWAGAILVGCLWLQFPLPLTIASYFGASEVWGWPWYGAILFAAPGLLLAIPVLLNGVIDMMRSATGRLRG